MRFKYSVECQRKFRGKMKLLVYNSIDNLCTQLKTSDYCLRIAF